MICSMIQLYNKKFVQFINAAQLQIEAFTSQNTLICPANPKKPNDWPES